MDYNKEKCKKLKKVRKEMADKLGLDLNQTECKFEGKCSGTCPKCQKEEEILNKHLLQKTAMIGVTTALTIGLAGCVPDTIDGLLEENKTEEIIELEGDLEEIPENEEIIEEEIFGDMSYIEEE